LTSTQSNFILLLRSALVNRTASLPLDADTTAILRLAADHKLHHMILAAMPLELLPEPQKRRPALLNQVTVQVNVTTAFLRLWAEMTDAGFHLFVIKGIVCRSLYPQPELRPSSDEDLYVSADEFEPCGAFLRERGMAPDKKHFSDYGEIGWRSKDGLYIELHRELFEGDELHELHDLFSFNTLQTEDYPTPYGKSVTSLPPHDHFLYLLLHAYKHFIHSGFGIRQICDIRLWAQKYNSRIDWHKLIEQCDTVRIRKFAAAVLCIARHDLQIEFSVPEELECAPDYSQPMLKDILCGGIYGSADTDRQHSVTMTLNAVKSAKNETKYSVWQSVFPSRETMENQYPYVKKRPFLLPAAWIQRIFTYAVRNKSGETHAVQSLSIGKERIELLRHYGILD
ncbi:MAG: nucleotidyltransferase family protein, partial [Clostridia bacterium]|nr:nucleotidyltransferase family protein [Clostridia bacterium]